jgi:hypothetical protein
MTNSRPRAAAGYVRFLGASVAVAVAVAALGYLPTLHLAGAAAVPALLAGCAVAVVASAAGGVPIALSGPGPANRPQAALLAMAVRLTTVLALGLAAEASGLFAARPLAIWTAISYVALLAVDGRYAMLPTAAAPPPAAAASGEGAASPGAVSEGGGGSRGEASDRR